ncbi:MAG: chalcone isomerase family protein [Leucothrix sp.]
MPLKNYLMGLLLMLLASPLWSGEGHVARSAELKIVGQAEMRWLMFPLYRVTLKTTDGRYQENRYPQMLDILYRRNIDRQDLLAATDNEWRGLGIPQGRRQKWIRQLSNLWPSIRRGDRLAFQVNAQGQNYFTYNGKKIGGIADQQFGKSFLAIWLSPKTSQPRIRQRLISL